MGLALRIQNYVKKNAMHVNVHYKKIYIHKKYKKKQKQQRLKKMLSVCDFTIMVNSGRFIPGLKFNLAHRRMVQDKTCRRGMYSAGRAR